MDKYRKLQGVRAGNSAKVESSPKMFTIADGVQIVAVDLKGFKGNRVDAKATIVVFAPASDARGHVGVFVDDNIHPLSARDFILDGNTRHTYELALSHISERDTTHLQVRVAALGSVTVDATISADELTLTPEAPKQIVGEIHPSLVVEPPKVNAESFLTSAPPGEAV